MRLSNRLLSENKGKRSSSSSSCRIPGLFPTLIMCGNINSWWIHSLPSWPQQGTHVTYRLLTQSARQDSPANLLSYFIMPWSVTHGNATLVKVDLQPCKAMLLWFCDLSRMCLILVKGSFFFTVTAKFGFFLFEEKTSQRILPSLSRYTVLSAFPLNCKCTAGHHNVFREC